MAKPTNKEELLSLSQSNFLKLQQLIENVTDQNQEFPAGTMNRNIRDVLTHLHHWHLMLLDWYHTGMKGEKPAMPAEGFSWKDTPELNRKIWKDCQNVSLEDAKKMLDNSYTDVRKIIKNHTNEELFEKKKYKWTGITSLGAYLISATSSHYDWGIKLIKKAFNFKSRKSNDKS